MKPQRPRVPHPAKAGMLLAAALLAGCSADHDELRQWMEQQRRDIKPSITPLQPPKKFDPEPYTQSQAVDPFNSQKLSAALKQEASAPSSLLARQVNRRKEPLEAFPLDSMTMVGSLVRQGQGYALLRIDMLLYQVRVGDHIGQNHGRITGISETGITLTETVQDAGGEWIERPATLQLQDRAR